MTEMKNRIPSIVFGKYTLDSLSIGMYNNPLMLMREYIQNAVDSLDQACQDGILMPETAWIDITVDVLNRSFSIRDNGAGVKADIAPDILHDIGNSLKLSNQNRGFRGIGRLGGLGYSSQLIFETKAVNENITSWSRWNCQKLRELINDNNRRNSARDILKEIIVFEQHLDQNINDHYFEVRLDQVRSGSDVLLDVPLIKRYISEVAPVPFRPNEFKHSKTLIQKLRKIVPGYSAYRITVNGEQIFKPYTDYVPLNKSSFDEIKELEFFDLLNHNGRLIATGWHGGLELLGTVSNNSGVDGLRVRKGNILIGNKDFLAKCFREKRFNSYLVGEIHVIDEQLIPNARRDDFEDNEASEEFYEAFMRTIGIPLSKEIRKRSKQRSRIAFFDSAHEHLQTVNNVKNDGFVTEEQKSEELRRLKNIEKDYRSTKFKDDIINAIEVLDRSEHIVDLNWDKRFHWLGKNGLKQICDIIYESSNSTTVADGIIRKIIKNYKNGKVEKKSGSHPKC